MRGVYRNFPALVLAMTVFAGLGFLSCITSQVPAVSPLPSEVPLASRPVPQSSGGVADEIRELVERGSPSSLLEALDIIRRRDLFSTEYGRAMTAVTVTLLKTLYPAVEANLPLSDPPLTHSYTRILRDNERGVYTTPSPVSADFLEHTLPFLAYYPRGGKKNEPPERYHAVLADLKRATEIKGDSALAGYLTGVAYEHAGLGADAYKQYEKTWELFPDCYPAALGIARVLDGRGLRDDSIRFLEGLAARYPRNGVVLRQLALAYYRAGEWARAETAVADILERSRQDAEFLLMRAHIYVELGRPLEAQAPLDAYAAINPAGHSRALYLFLRARLQAEVFSNRDNALAYLRTLLRTSPAENGVSEALFYTVRLLSESRRAEDQKEARELLSRLLAAPSPSLEAVSLALRDAIRRESWAEARPFLERLLRERRSGEDLLAAYTVEREAGTRAAALAFARELYERDRNHDDGIIPFISALIESGRQREAAAMIESRLAGLSGCILKSRYYLLSSRVRENEEDQIADLRASLFEDPSNLDTLIALTEFYHSRRDERRAQFYLRQAQALAPHHPRLRRFETTSNE